MSIQARRQLETCIISKNLPYIRKLLETTKIDKQEKLRVLEDINIDVASYLLSIGEDI